MRSLRLIALLAIPAQLASAQQQNPTSQGTPLALDEAIQTAQRNNPTLQQTKSNIGNADAQVRQARGALFPQVSANAFSRYTQAGTQYQFGVAFPTQASVQSQYGLNVNYNISAGLAFAPKAAKATRAAAEADVASSTEVVRATITQQYITALQAEATAAVLDTLVTVAQGQLDLANAKMAVGAGTIIDVRAAEVALGQAQVNSLTQHNLARVNKLQLYQTMGVPADIDAKLTTNFTITAPTFTLDSVLSLARRVNPDIRARESRQTAANASLQLARTQYLPTLSLQTGYAANAFGYSDYNYLPGQAAAQQLSGYRSCVSTDSLRAAVGLGSRACGSPTLTTDSLSRIRGANQPFSFTSSPLYLQAVVSIPIFNGFQREGQIEQSRVTRDNAILDVRARNLQLTTDVSQAYLNLVTTAKTAELQTQIASKAAEDLALNQESYKVGAKTFLDVTTANATYQKAQIDRINSVYDYQKAFAQLENAVGRPLR
jgi:outer membrane protein